MQCKTCVHFYYLWFFKKSSFQTIHIEITHNSWGNYDEYLQVKLCTSKTLYLVCVYMCSGIRTRILIPTDEVVRVFQYGFQPQIVDKPALYSGYPTISCIYIFSPNRLKIYHLSYLVLFVILYQSQSQGYAGLTTYVIDICYVA